MVKNIYLLCFLIFFLWPKGVWAQSDESPSSSDNLSYHFYKSLGEFTWKLGNKRGIGVLDFMIPLYSQRHQDIFFLDLRFVRDNKSSREYNVGLAYRYALPNSYLKDYPITLGLYGFYDYRLSPNRNAFRQATLGIEALHPWVEGRVNVYLPTKHQYELPGTGAVANSFNGFYYYTSSSNLKEGAMGGLDAEVGARVPMPWGDDYQLRFYGGGYKFERNGYKTVSGPRVRTEFLVYNPLEIIVDLPASRLKVGAEYAYDRVRGNIGFLEIGLRIPLGSFADKNKQDDLDRTFQRSVERDVDIVVNSNKSIDVTKLTMAGADGKPTRFYHVDGNAEAGGNGSAESPFNTVQEAANAAGTDETNGLSSYPVIYVTSNVTSNASEQVNFDYTQAARNLTHITLTSPAAGYTSGSTTIPASTNIKPILQASSAWPAIYLPNSGHNLKSITIAGLQIENDSDAGGFSVLIQGVSALSPVQATISDSVIRYTGTNAGIGLEIYTYASATITNTTISSTGNDGLYVFSSNGDQTTCTNCTISTTHTGNDAVGAWNNSNVTLNNCALSASHDGGYGVNLYNATVTMNGGSISNANIGVFADYTSTAIVSGATINNSVGSFSQVGTNGSNSITGVGNFV